MDEMPPVKTVAVFLLAMTQHIKINFSRRTNGGPSKLQAWVR